MSPWLSDAVSVNEVRIHYYRTGGAKPPVVLLHGITDNGLCWTRVAQRLERDYDVIMLDARGHGLSDAPEAGYTAEEQAPDVAGVIRALELDCPILLAHSMGAATAAATAAHYPEMIRAMILEDPPWGGPPAMLSAEEKDARIKQWQASMLKRKNQTVEAIVSYGRRRNPSWDEREIALWAEAIRQTSPNIASGINGRGIRWQDVVRHIKCPVLLITADHSAGAIVTAEAVAEAMSLCPTLEAAYISGAGHNIRREQFEKFMAVVTAYLQAVCDGKLVRVDHPVQKPKA